MRFLRFYGFILICLFAHSGFAQGGKVFDNLSLHSEILKSERKFAIYLPPGYETSQRSYPVLYLLHGGGDDQTGWVQLGEVGHITDNAILSGKSTPLIIVMPDAQTRKRGYFNDIKNKWRYEDFFFEEFMPYIEKNYRIRGKKRYRAIAGLSMGGGGTFMYALHHPELFSSACPLSASVGPLSLDAMKERLARSKEPFDELQVQEYYEQHNALSLVNNLADENKKAIRWYIDCGDDDFLYEGNSLVHIAMRKTGIPHEFRIRDGNHNWTYWREALPEVLKFVTEGFHN